jgi:Helix-turn-helix domain
MQLQKETRIIDLTVEQLVALIADSLPSLSPSELSDDAPLNVAQACHFLGDMPKPTLYFKCHKGIMPHIKQGGRLYFFKKDLVDWLREYTVVSSEKKAANFMDDFKATFQNKK